MFKAGGHTKLISLLGGDSPTIVANSAAAIYNMAEQEIIHNSLLSHGVIPALVKPLSSTNVQVLVNTLHCLEVLVCDTERMAEVGVCICAGQNGSPHLSIVQQTFSLSVL